MQRHVLVIIASFFLFCAPVWSAQLLPFQGNLSSEIEQDFKSLVNASLSSDQNQFVLARNLLRHVSSSNLATQAWCRLIYAHVLLENDSIIKARKIFEDSSSVHWNDQPMWLQSYRSYGLGLAALYSGEYSVAGKQFQRTLVLAEDVQQLQLLATEGLADNLRFQGKLELSINRWYEALDLAEALKDSLAIFDSYQGRGVVRLVNGELDLAEEDINASFSYFKQVGARKRIAYSYSLLGLIEYRKRNYLESIDLNLKGYNLRGEISDTKGQGESLNNLALAYMGLKNWSQALRYLEEAVQLKTSANDLTQMTVIFNNIGHCFRKLGNRKDALKYFELALEKGKANGQLGDMVVSYRNIMNLYASEKDFESAFNAQSKLVALQDSLSEIERSEAMAEVEIRYNTEQKEQEILMLQQKQTIITNRWLTLAMGLFLTIIIGILFADNQKRKHRQQTQLLVKEDELQKAELKIMSDLLEYNQRKLNLYMENMLKKNEMVVQLESSLRSAVGGSLEDEAHGRKLVEDFSAVRILTEDDWQEFKELFDGVHKGMLDRLLRSYENLTLAEQRLFLLMKLNLSTKEMANILGVSPESIKKGRYRLKKKIGIDDETSLQDYVTSF